MHAIYLLKIVRPHWHRSARDIEPLSKEEHRKIKEK